MIFKQPLLVTNWNKLIRYRINYSIHNHTSATLTTNVYNYLLLWAKKTVGGLERRFKNMLAR